MEHPVEARGARGTAFDPPSGAPVRMLSLFYDFAAEDGQWTLHLDVLPGRSTRECAGPAPRARGRQFKTMKYRPGFPERFGSIEVARGFCRPFFDWYSHTHRHSGIGLMTPAAVHYGRAGALHAERARVLATAFAANPQRFVRGAPMPPPLPTAAWINRPTTQEVAR